jgi:hypothetical protein
MSRGYIWRGGCPAADVPDVGDGSVEWFGEIKSLFFRSAILLSKRGRREDLDSPNVSVTR